MKPLLKDHPRAVQLCAQNTIQQTRSGAANTSGRHEQPAIVYNRKVQRVNGGGGGRDAIKVSNYALPRSVGPWTLAWEAGGVDGVERGGTVTMGSCHHDADESHEK